MPTDSNSHDSQDDGLVQGLLAGEEAAYAQLVQQYAGRLRLLADRKLSPGIRRRVEAEDVVQSVCRTFFRRTNLGQFEVPDEAHLWSLLCAITVAKTNEQLRFHMRQRRNPNLEQHFESVSPDRPAAAGDPVGQDAATSEQEVEFAEQFEKIISGLDEEDQKILDLKLRGTTNEEIADQLGCSERTVRRILQRLQSRFEQEFESM